jgi:small-conductance mechanosensitive channel
MNKDPLQQIWQSHQLELPVEEIMQQAKTRQRRMFLFMVSDVVMTFGLIIWALFHVQQNPEPKAMHLALFIVSSVFIYGGYSLWVRASTWGLDSLDAKNTLILTIKRSESAIQMCYISVIFCIVVAAGMVFFAVTSQDATQQSITFAIIWSILWTMVCIIGSIWYRKRQLKKVALYSGILEQLYSEQLNDDE